MAWRGRGAARQAGRGGEGMSMEMMGICSVVPDTALLMFELANLACIFHRRDSTLHFEAFIQ